MAKRTEEVRTAKKMSRAELANKLGVTRLQIWRIETGTTQVRADFLPRLARALGVETTELVA